MKVSVLILNYRTPQETVACVQRFLQQTIVENIEIIVIDNHSLDDSIGVLRNTFGSHPSVRIIETSKNGGFGVGYNVGSRYAKGEYLLINNPVKHMPKDGVEVLLRTIASDSSIGILAPRIRHPDGSDRHSIRRFPHLLDILARRTGFSAFFAHRLRTYLMLDADLNMQQEVDWVVGGCLMLSRRLFEDIGGFDERFFLFFEDTDICRRVREQGMRIVYTPQVVVQDRKSRLSGEGFFDLLWRKTGREHVVSAWKYFAKWGFS